MRHGARHDPSFAFTSFSHALRNQHHCPAEPAAFKPPQCPLVFGFEKQVAPSLSSFSMFLETKRPGSILVSCSTRPFKRDAARSLSQKHPTASLTSLLCTHQRTLYFDSTRPQKPVAKGQPKTMAWTRTFEVSHRMAGRVKQVVI